MKKYMVLAVSTALAMALIFGVRAARAPRAVAVTLVDITATTVRKTVECNGKVEATSSQEVLVQVPCVAKKVYVSEGQQVSKGDVLFSVDTEATRQVLAQWNTAMSETETEALSETVTAPIAGEVVSLSIREGALVDTAKPCAVIRAQKGVRIGVTVKEKDLSCMALGQAVEISGVAFAQKVYQGTVTAIAETAHQEYIGTVSETVVDAVVTLENPDDSLRAGLNAKATVITEVKEKALLVPYDCIGQTEEGAEFVYVYDEAGKARWQQPVFGEEYRDGVLVVSGLASGVRLVQNPEALSGDSVWVQER